MRTFFMKLISENKANAFISRCGNLCLALRTCKLIYSLITEFKLYYMVYA